MGCKAGSDLCLMRGEDAIIEVTVTDEDGEPQDITGWKLFFSIKRYLDDADPLVLKRNTAAGGGDGQILALTQSGATLGQFKVFVDRADTVAMDIAGHRYDAWVVVPTGESYALFAPGNVSIARPVTLELS